MISSQPWKGAVILLLCIFSTTINSQGYGDATRKHSYLIDVLPIQNYSAVFLSQRTVYLDFTKVSDGIPYLSESAVATNSDMFVTLIYNNLQVKSQRIRLHLTIEGEGISIRSSSTFFPRAIELQPNVPITLGNNELSEYFDLDNLVFSNFSKQAYLENGGLPDGFYRICIEAIDYQYDSHRPLSFPACENLKVELFDVPYFTEPVQDIKLSSNDKINFSWDVSRKRNFGDSYVFEIYEYNPYLKDYQIPKLEAPVLSMQSDKNKINFSDFKGKLEDGKIYSAFARIMDRSNASFNYRNNGYSEALRFGYGSSSRSVNCNEEIVFEIVVVNGVEYLNAYVPSCPNCLVDWGYYQSYQYGMVPYTNGVQYNPTITVGNCEYSGSYGGGQLCTVGEPCEQNCVEGTLDFNCDCKINPNDIPVIPMIATEFPQGYTFTPDLSGINCDNPSYAWNTGETSSLIYFQQNPAFVGVKVICDDGCEYVAKYHNGSKGECWAGTPCNDYDECTINDIRRYGPGCPCQGDPVDCSYCSGYISLNVVATGSGYVISALTPGCTPETYEWSTGDDQPFIGVNDLNQDISLTVICEDGCTYSTSYNGDCGPYEICDDGNPNTTSYYDELCNCISEPCPDNDGDGNPDPCDDENCKVELNITELSGALTAEVTNCGNVSYLWNTGATTESISYINPNAVYMVTVTCDDGCVAIDSYGTDGCLIGDECPPDGDPCTGPGYYQEDCSCEYDNLTVSFSYDASINNNEGTLTASIDCSAVTYDWNTGEDTPSITVSDFDISYTVVITCENGCSYSGIYSFNPLICIPGTPCNDGDPCTEDDQIDEDCDCMGTPIVDENGDPITEGCTETSDCDAILTVSTNEVNGDVIYTANIECDDVEFYWSNGETGSYIVVPNDNSGYLLQVLCDGCYYETTVGNPECVIGLPCDDDDDCTYNDMYFGDCGCVGEPSGIAFDALTIQPPNCTYTFDFPSTNENVEEIFINSLSLVYPDGSVVILDNENSGDDFNFAYCIGCDNGATLEDLINDIKEYFSGVDFVDDQLIISDSDIKFTSFGISYNEYEGSYYFESSDCDEEEGQPGDFVLTAVALCDADNVSYLWNTGETTESITVYALDVEYTVTVTCGGCELVGTYQGEPICEVGTPCEAECVVNGVLDENCECVGDPAPDADGDGICDESDDCPDIPNDQDSDADGITDCEECSSKTITFSEPLDPIVENIYTYVIEMGLFFEEGYTLTSLGGVTDADALEEYFKLPYCKSDCEGPLQDFYDINDLALHIDGFLNANGFVGYACPNSNNANCAAYQDDEVITLIGTDLNFNPTFKDQQGNLIGTLSPQGQPVGTVVKGYTLFVEVSDCEEAKYKWSNGEETQSITIQNPEATYKVTVTCGDGCFVIGQFGDGPCVTGESCTDIVDPCYPDPVYDEYCHCIGEYVGDEDGDGVCDPIDQCDGMNDLYDLNQNGIPDCLECQEPDLITAILHRIGLQPSEGHGYIYGFTYTYMGQLIQVNENTPGFSFPYAVVNSQNTCNASTIEQFVADFENWFTGQGLLIFDFTLFAYPEGATLVFYIDEDVELGNMYVSKECPSSFYKELPFGTGTHTTVEVPPSCDDNDPCTVNDQFVYLEDGSCICEGEFIDSDQDGVSDADGCDQCPDYPDHLAEWEDEDGNIKYICEPFHQCEPYGEPIPPCDALKNIFECVNMQLQSEKVLILADLHAMSQAMMEEVQNGFIPTGLYTDELFEQLLENKDSDGDGIVDYLDPCVDNKELREIWFDQFPWSFLNLRKRLGVPEEIEVFRYHTYDDIKECLCSAPPGSEEDALNQMKLGQLLHYMVNRDVTRPEEGEDYELENDCYVEKWVDCDCDIITIPVDDDNDGIQDGPGCDDTIGPCEPTADCTSSDPCIITYVDENCECIEAPMTDTDGDGVCDPIDICDGFDDNADADGDGYPDGCDPCAAMAFLSPGDPCDDGDDCTYGEYITGGDGEPCNCGNGITVDTDDDGVTDCDDACPGFDDAEDYNNDGIPDGCDPPYNPIGCPDAIDFYSGGDDVGIFMTYPDPELDDDEAPNPVEFSFIAGGQIHTVKLKLGFTQNLEPNDDYPEGYSQAMYVLDEDDPNYETLQDLLSGGSISYSGQISYSDAQNCHFWQGDPDEEENTIPPPCPQNGPSISGENTIGLTWLFKGGNIDLSDFPMTAKVFMEDGTEIEAPILFFNVDEYNGEFHLYAEVDISPYTPFDITGAIEFNGIQCYQGDPCEDYNGNLDSYEGDACDDGDDFTYQDTYDENCNCVGIPKPDLDCDGIPDEFDVCPGVCENGENISGDDGADADGDGIPDDCECPVPQDVTVELSNEEGEENTIILTIPTQDGTQSDDNSYSGFTITASNGTDDPIVLDQDYVDNGDGTISITISNVPPGYMYDISIVSACNSGNESNPAEVEIDVPFGDGAEFCGIDMSPIDLSSLTFLPSLSNGEEFSAADFIVRVKESKGSYGKFTGKGYIKIPFFGNPRINVSFNNITISIDRQMVDGYVKIDGLGLAVLGDDLSDDINDLVDDIVNVLQDIQDKLDAVEHLLEKVDELLSELEGLIDQATLDCLDKNNPNSPVSLLEAKKDEAQNLVDQGLDVPEELENEINSLSLQVKDCNDDLQNQMNQILGGYSSYFQYALPLLLSNCDLTALETDYTTIKDQYQSQTTQFVDEILNALPDGSESLAIQESTDDIWESV